VAVLTLAWPARAAADWQPLGQSIDGNNLEGAPSLVTVGGFPYVAYLGSNDGVRASFDDGTGWQRLGGALNMNPAAPVPDDGTPGLRRRFRQSVHRVCDAQPMRDRSPLLSN
jgi:hypothetical protein